MDISKFNKELADKVAKAKIHEKRDELKEAVNIWLDICEMALKASKVSGLNAHYRKMLMNKTEQMILHIKSLKSKLIKPIEYETIDREFLQPIPQDDVYQEQESNEPIEEREIESQEIKLQEDPSQETQPQEIKEVNTLRSHEYKDEIAVLRNIEIIEESKYKNMPEGFKEIKTSEDFNIITPHDENHVKNLISEDHNRMSITHQNEQVFKQANEKANEQDNLDNRGQTDGRIELDQPEDKEKILCFACGNEQKASAEICDNCGTKLK